MSNKISQILICDRCGAEARVWGEDGLDRCDECGIVEGNTHWETPE